MTVQEYRITKGKPVARYELVDDMLIVYITPVAKPRMTQRDKWQKRPCVLRYREYCDRLRATCAVAGYKLEDFLHVAFHIPCPKSWSKKKVDEHAGKPHQQRPDIDNLVKAAMDALADEDKHVHSIRASKRWIDKRIGQVVFYLPEQ